jgi:hypothetical protein
LLFSLLTRQLPMNPAAPVTMIMMGVFDAKIVDVKESQSNKVTESQKKL